MIETIYNTINNYLMNNLTYVDTKTFIQVYNDIVSILQTGNPNIFNNVITNPTTLDTVSIF